MFQSQMEVNGDQSTEVWPKRGGYTCPRHPAVEWPAVYTITSNPVTSEPWRLPSSSHKISIGLRWSQTYGSTLAAARCATESKHHVMDAMDSTCHFHRVFIPGRDLPWISLPTCQCQWHQDTPESSYLLTVWLKWQLTSPAEGTFTPQS